jgi:hypothetical protein
MTAIVQRRHMKAIVQRSRITATVQRRVKQEVA